jgi:hypothetical protein
VDVGAAVQLARRLSGLTEIELAEWAELPVGRLRRIEADLDVPGFEEFEDLLTVAGYRVDRAALVPRCEPAAIVAARHLIDPADGIVLTAAAQRCAQDWHSRGIVEPHRLALRAGRSARLSIRRGVQEFLAGSSDAIGRAVRAGELPYVLSSMSSSVVCYVADVDAAAVALRRRDVCGDRVPPGTGRLVLLPLDEVSLAGATLDDSGRRRAAPAQLLIDRFAGELGRIGPRASLVRLGDQR